MQPRVLMAMARDGLLPRWFSRLSPSTGTPTNATVTSGFVAAAMAFAMNIDQLSGMVRTGSCLSLSSSFRVCVFNVLSLRDCSAGKPSSGTSAVIWGSCHGVCNEHYPAVG